MQDTLLTILHLLNEMSPFLLLGFLFAGILHVYVPGAVYHRYLSGSGFRSVWYATLLGIPLPLCSCGVIPTAMGLRRDGASRGATVSFLIATPETGVDSIAATYSLMGLPFAIVRPLTALFTALMAGTLVNRWGTKTVAPVDEEPKKCCCCCHEKKRNRVLAALDYAFVDMMGDIGKWLVVGLVVAALITVFVPSEWFDIFRGHTLLSMVAVLAVAIPMYICATGSIPIAVALIMKGLTPGAALVMLMAGPACNAATLLLVGKKLGRRTLAIYLASIIAGAVGAGFIIDRLPAAWFMPTLLQTGHAADAAGAWWQTACTVLLIVLLAGALLRHHGHEH